MPDAEPEADLPKKDFVDEDSEPTEQQHEHRHQRATPAATKASY